MKCKVKDAARFLRYYIPALVRLFTCAGKGLLLVGTPLHGNIGDQAIVLGEIEYFKRSFPQYRLIEVPSRVLVGNERLWKSLAWRTRAVLIHGGGFFGTLWADEDEMLRRSLEAFSAFPIIVMPQTLYFEKGEEDPKIEEYQRIIASCPQISICVRERESFALAKRLFGRDKVYLVPDMVLNLDSAVLDLPEEKSGRSSGGVRVLFCLRQDKEGTVNAREKERLREAVEASVPTIKVEETDTVIAGRVSPSMRRRVVKQKVEEFGAADLVVTDRLHGMVLSAISGTPTIALGSRSPKVEGVYNHALQGLRNVRFCGSLDEVPEAIRSVFGKRECYRAEKMQSKYSELTSIILDVTNGGRDNGRY